MEHTCVGASLVDFESARPVVEIGVRAVVALPVIYRGWQWWRVRRDRRNPETADSTFINPYQYRGLRAERQERRFKAHDAGKNLGVLPAMVLAGAFFFDDVLLPDDDSLGLPNDVMGAVANILGAIIVTAWLSLLKPDFYKDIARLSTYRNWWPSEKRAFWRGLAYALVIGTIMLILLWGFDWGFDTLKDRMDWW